MNVDEPLSKPTGVTDTDYKKASPSYNHLLADEVLSEEDEKKQNDEEEKDDPEAYEISSSESSSAKESVYGDEGKLPSFNSNLHRMLAYPFLQLNLSLI